MTGMTPLLNRMVAQSRWLMKVDIQLKSGVNGGHTVPPHSRARLLLIQRSVAAFRVSTEIPSVDPP
jgi:hypothetical protein